VQDGFYDAFKKRLAEIAGAMKLADGFEPGAGSALIDMNAVEKDFFDRYLVPSVFRYI
jgi:hypothetical protein